MNKRREGRVVPTAHEIFSYWGAAHLIVFLRREWRVEAAV